MRPVSARLISSRYVAVIPGYVIGRAMVIAAIVLTALTGWWWITLIGIVPLDLVVEGLALTPRRVRAQGYREGGSEEHTSEDQSRGHLVCRLLLDGRNSQDSR